MELAIKKIAKYKRAMGTLLLIIVFSIINVITVATSDTYFLFSSYVSLIITSLVYDATSQLATALIVGIVSMIPLIVCLIFARKHWGFMVAGLVLIVIDTVFLAIDFFVALEAGLAGSFVINLIVHAWALFDLVSAIIAKDAVKYMKEEKKGKLPGANQGDDSVYECSEDQTTLEEPTIATAEETAIQRKIIIKRPKNFVACMVTFSVIIDGAVVAQIKNGQDVTIEVNGASHALLIKMPNGFSSDVLQISAGSKDESYTIKPVRKFSSVHIEIQEG